MSRFKRIRSALAGTVVGVVAGLSIGVAATAVVASSVASEDSNTVNHPRNAAGQTFGSEMHAQSMDEVPDLILAVGDNGEEGYLRKADLYLDPPSSPEAAAAASLNGLSNRVINLYAEDGKTIIGLFTIHNENSQSSETPR